MGAFGMFLMYQLALVQTKSLKKSIDRLSDKIEQLVLKVTEGK